MRGGARAERTGAEPDAIESGSQQAHTSALFMRISLNRPRLGFDEAGARPSPFPRLVLNSDHRHKNPHPPENPPPASRSHRFAGLPLPWFTRSATQHGSCQLDFFLKKSFRHPVLACFVLVPAPAAPDPTGFRFAAPPASIHQLPGRNRANFLHSPPFTSFLLEGFCPKKNPGGSNSSGVPRLAMTRVLPGKVFHHTNDARTPPHVPHSQKRRYR